MATKKTAVKTPTPKPSALDVTLDNIEKITKRLKDAGIPFKSERLDESSDPMILLSLLPSRKTGQICLDFDDRSQESHDATAPNFPLLDLLDLNDEFRQAVLRIREEKRVITRQVIVYTEDKGKKAIVPGDQEVIRAFPIGLPSNTEYSSVEIKREKVKLKTQHSFTYNVTATIPRSDMHFLIGFDEKHLFISALPRAVKTVVDAHKALMPKEVVGKKGVLRQGEFFFVPVTDAEKKIIIQETNDKNYCYSSVPLDKSDNDESDHIATCVIATPDRKEFCTGYVGNERHSLFLDGWYRVYPNTELPNPSDEQTWD